MNIKDLGQIIIRLISNGRLSPRAISEIPSKIKTEWQWGLFEDIADRKYVNTSSRVHNFLRKVENKWDLKESSVDIVFMIHFCIVIGKKRKVFRQQWLEREEKMVRQERTL